MVEVSSHACLSQPAGGEKLGTVARGSTDFTVPTLGQAYGATPELYLRLWAILAPHCLLAGIDGVQGEKIGVRHPRPGTVVFLMTLEYFQGAESSVSCSLLDDWAGLVRVSKAKFRVRHGGK